MEHFTQALQLAQQAMPLSNPNPRVGCVIVSADGRIIGRGHTQRAGEAHAEIMALRDAASRGASVAGSTVYVTLEPCAHQGRTPPCCDALIAAGVGRVMVALADPNPLVAGQGLQRLRAAGIDVQLAGPDSAEARAARDINIGFLHRMQHAVPWVRLKTASSLDGRTALPNGQSQWITGDASHHKTTAMKKHQQGQHALLRPLGAYRRARRLLPSRLKIRRSCICFSDSGSGSSTLLPMA